VTKVALIHDYLNQYGGAERVLEALLDIFPDTHIYTLLYSPERTSALFEQKVYKTSILDFPLARRYHRIFIPFMPLAVRSLKILDKYDLILSDSAGYAKGIPCKEGTFHLCYCYTPLRYAWEVDNYFGNPFFKTVFRPAFDYLRRWDFKAAQAPDTLLAVSAFIAGKISKYYGRTAKVVYPPVDYKRFYFDSSLQPTPGGPSYYIAAGRLLHYKKFKLVIEAFMKLGLNLYVVGTGPELAGIQLMSAGARNIRIMPFVSDEELHALYSGAKALIFPQVEDFGLVAAEAQACGTPVIAFAGGGALEIVEENRTGLFFHEQSVEAIVEAVRRFEQVDYDRHEVSVRSRRFTVESFRDGLMQSLPDDLKIGMSCQRGL
jgi:glycosyltransferase involved in cell wall biosynthesis